MQQGRNTFVTATDFIISIAIKLPHFYFISLDKNINNVTNDLKYVIHQRLNRNINKIYITEIRKKIDY